MAVAEPAEVSVTAAPARHAVSRTGSNSLNLFRLILAALVLFAHSWYITGHGTGPIDPGREPRRLGGRRLLRAQRIPHHPAAACARRRASTCSIGSRASIPRSSSCSSSRHSSSRPIAAAHRAGLAGRLPHDARHAVPVRLGQSRRSTSTHYTIGVDAADRPVPRRVERVAVDALLRVPLLHRRLGARLPRGLPPLAAPRRRALRR